MVGTEAVAQRYYVKNVFLKTLQNSQEKACARVSFLIKLYVCKCIQILVELHFLQIIAGEYLDRYVRGVARTHANI